MLRNGVMYGNDVVAALLSGVVSCCVGVTWSVYKQMVTVRKRRRRAVEGEEEIRCCNL